MKPPAVSRIEDHALSLSNLPNGICEECLVSLLRHLFSIKLLFLFRVHHAPVKRHSGQSFPQHVRREYLPVEFASEHSRERALSRSDATHHYHDHWCRAGDGIAKSKLKVVPRLPETRFPGGNLPRIQALHALDLAAHIGAVALVEIHQARHAVVIERGRHLGGEIAREIGPAFVVQIHRQEGGVVRHVHVAEAVVELDAVVDVQRARRDMNVFEVQVAVAVADALFLDARGEEPRVPRRTGSCKSESSRRPGGRSSVADELSVCRKFSSVLMRRLFDAAPRLDRSGRVLCFVEFFQRRRRFGFTWARPTASRS